MQMHRVIAIVLFVGLACSRVAAADPFDDASAAYKRGDHETARRLFRPLAEKGNVGAQVNLANLYALQGEGVYAKEAALWYRKAAEQGNADGQTRLGALYSEGQGVLQDYAEAMLWYRKAAEQGNDDAQFSLGVMYDQGQGVPLDYAEAALWYRKAAEQGHARSQSNLGALYSAGQGVPRDYVQAHMWFNLAASREDERHVRDSIVKNRDRVAKLMTLAQIAEAQRLAQDWKPK
jgi:TPR repeat protein